MERNMQNCFYVHRVGDIFLLFSKFSIMFSHYIFLVVEKGGFPDSFERNDKVQGFFV